MGFLLKQTIGSLTVSLNVVKLFGLLVPGQLTKKQRTMFMWYQISWYIYMNGIYLIVQAGDLFLIWGDVPLMVSTSLLLFTNIALGMKIINVMLRRSAVQNIIDDGEKELANEDREEGVAIIQSCNRETSQFSNLYIFLAATTVAAWATSAESGDLPLRAWYPYDTSKSPAYELTYFYQISALSTSAAVNINLDIVATSLIAVCRCRLKLVNLSLMNLCKGPFVSTNGSHQTVEEIILERVKACVRHHQAVLSSARQIQRCFSIPVLAQFTVSMVIICVTAYQLVVELHDTPINVVRLASMSGYLLCMTLQVFLYCYQGNQLMIESTEVASAAYSCPWYLCSLRFRRALLIIMIRSKRASQLTAGGFTTLSLSCFTAIVKASYTFFTVLQRVEDRQK
uniref:Odorant receptor n=1 Tax=Semiothisa cinerearia TaxID=2249628 RepID=A0A889XL93_9NEOP|nr:odorant receptor [Semiothisa cinerearia]